MPAFQYTIRDITGAVRTGTSEAENQEILKRRLQEQGFTVNDLKQIYLADEQRSKRIFRASLPERVEFWLLLSTQLESNVPLLRAMDMAAEQMEKARFRKALKKIRAEMGGGKTLSEAMRAYTNLFDKVSIGIIRAGEEGGTLKEAVRRLHHHLEHKLERQSRTRIGWIQLLTGVLIAVIVGLILRIP